MTEPQQANVAVAANSLFKNYGSVEALKDVSLSINDNEFFTLLGPSGCGKTTLLRIIAGFEAITAGTLFLHGKNIADLPANKRPVNTVFQHYSLFPHMSVADNVGFGLEMQGKDKKQIIQRTKEMLELVQLGEYAQRKPGQLSGGQQQRVALARALAPQPEVLLLDEPLSALDLKLRKAMRLELKQIQENAGITFIFVTHDQEEALTMSDRIAVMSQGELQQLGTATQIYQEPKNRFVADFIGESNLITTTVLNADSNSIQCKLSDSVSITTPNMQGAVQGDQGALCIRPERIRLSNAGENTKLEGVVDGIMYLGTDTQVMLKLDDQQTLSVRTQNADNNTPVVEVGQRVGLHIDESSCRFLSES